MKRMKGKQIAIILSVTVLTGILAGCSKASDDASSVSGRTMVLKSDNLHDGVWDDVISNTASGSNHSPGLSWEPVDGAGVYAIYMVDASANNWLHWKSECITSTSLTEGQIPSSEYVGPYPPSGTHTYDIYVLALKAPAKALAGEFDAANPDPDVLLSSADTDKEGNTGNIIATAKISGTFTHRDAEMDKEQPETINIGYVNEISTADVWIIADIEENHKTSLWGMAALKDAEPEKEYSADIVKSSDDHYLLRMIDKDELYYESGSITLRDGYSLLVYETDDFSEPHIVISDDRNEEVEDIGIFRAAL